MPIQLGNDFETALLTAAGIDPNTIDPGSLDITYLNPNGPSTIRCTLILNVDTDTIKQAIRNAVPD